MKPPEFAEWKQKVLLGASVRVIAPTGQYDPTKIVNWGINRWAFKPEFGYSERWGNWVLDAYTGVWFYTTNQAFGPVGKGQNESPIGSFEGHFSHDFKRPGTWVSFDGNFPVGWADEPERYTKPEDRAGRLTHQRHRCVAFYQTSVA